MTSEQYVSAKIAAEYLGISRRFLLSLARRGMAGCYPVGNGESRRRWVFKLSELDDAIDPKRRVPPPTEPNPCPTCRARREFTINGVRLRRKDNGR